MIWFRVQCRSDGWLRAYIQKSLQEGLPDARAEEAVLPGSPERQLLADADDGQHCERSHVEPIHLRAGRAYHQGNGGQGSALKGSRVIRFRV